MPTYEYECESCGWRFDAFQSITAQPLKSCPKCDKKLKRLIGGGGGIIFKGAGFYATDYRKKTKQEKSEPKQPVSCPKLKEGCRGCVENPQQ